MKSKMDKIPKFRKHWTINPSSRVHSTKKGKRGYNRQISKKIEKGEDFT